MKKALCIIYPNFSLYEVVGLTSTLALSFGIEIDYVGSDRGIITSEDGLACQPTRTLDEVVIEDYSCVILPGMINIAPALHDEKLISFLRSLKQQEVLIAAISSAPILLAKAGLLKDNKFTGGTCLDNDWTRTININTEIIGINFISKGWLNTIGVMIVDFGTLESLFDGLGAGFDGKRL